MIERILKIELISLLFLTLITLVYHLYGNQFPDNFLSISSFAGDLNFISYYIFSFFSIIGLAIGPWLLIPFVFYSLAYHFKYSRRDYKLDLLGIFYLILFFGSFFSMLSSKYLGTGVQQVFESSLPPLTTMWTMIISLILFLFTTFRKTTHRYYKKLLENVLNFSFQGLKEALKIKVARFNDKIEERRKANHFKKSAEKLHSPSRSSWKTKNGFKKLLPLKEPVKMPKIIKDVARNISKDQAKVFINEEVLEKKITKEKNVTEVDKEKQSNFNEENDAIVATVREPSIGKRDYMKVVEGLSYKEADQNAKPLDPGYFTDIKERIEDKLQEFNINAQIIDVMKGPVVDTFELELGEGVQLSKVLNREKDVSLALLGASIRIVYPLKGKRPLV